MIPTKHHVNYKAIGFSHRGKVRQKNEDSYLVRQRSSDFGPVLLAAVADGMGGLQHGAQASQMLIQALDIWWQQALPEILEQGMNMTDLEQSLEEHIASVNDAMLQKTEKMGTTLSLLLLIGETYLIKHIGDSRIYFLRRIGLEQVTNDHTLYEQEKMRGTMQYDIQPVEKKKNVLVNAIGVTSAYYVETARGDLRNVESILLCSDGVYRYVSQAKLEKLLKSWLPIQQKGNKLEQLVQRSEARDNYTAILIQQRKSRWEFASV